MDAPPSSGRNNPCEHVRRESCRDQNRGTPAAIPGPQGRACGLQFMLGEKGTGPHHRNGSSYSRHVTTLEHRSTHMGPDVCLKVGDGRSVKS